MHFKLHEGALVEGHELSDEMKEALDIALRDEIRRESHQGSSLISLTVFPHSADLLQADPEVE